MVSYLAQIYLIIYFIYILSLLIDTQYILNNPSIVFGIFLFAIFAVLFLTFLLMSLKAEGIKILDVKTSYLALIIGICIGSVILIAVWYYYSNQLNTVTLQQKYQQNHLIPLIYTYGRDSDDIRQKLNIDYLRAYVGNILGGFINFNHVSAVFAPDAHKTLEEIWEAHMSEFEKLKSLYKQIFDQDFRDTPDVLYNLFWYLCISEEPLRNRLTVKEIQSVLALNNLELLELVQSNRIKYEGATDRASLIFTILSGQVVEYQTSENFTERYELIKSYDPIVVYNLAFNHHKIINHDIGTYSILPPYIYLATQTPSTVEDIILQIDHTNCNDLIEKYQLVKGDYKIKDKVNFVRHELSLYNNVFTRPSGIAAPPNLENLNNDAIDHVLSQYTNVELIDAYEPRFQWVSRNDLLRIIKSDVIGRPKWSFTHNYCTNDDTMNVMSGTDHSEVDKDDITDPTVSYGVQKNYRCYQCSELEGAFNDYDGVFMFKVPDWTANSNIPREFPIDSIKQLLEILYKCSWNVRSLINKIEYGLKQLKSAKMQTLALKREYDNFTQEEKDIVDKYLAWMFLYAMWMRFWKGPGNNWPTMRFIDRRASVAERDEHVFIQEGVRTAIIELYENNDNLRTWINSLPVIYYDFETKEASCASHAIKETLDKIALGDYCMGFGSDTILKTGYYYITHLLEYPEGTDFMRFMDIMLPIITDLEYHVVTRQINNVREKSVRYQVLRERLTNLQRPLGSLQPFDPSTYRNNIHVE